MERARDVGCGRPVHGPDGGRIVHQTAVRGFFGMFPVWVTAGGMQPMGGRRQRWWDIPARRRRRVPVPRHDGKDIRGCIGVQVARDDGINRRDVQGERIVDGRRRRVVHMAGAEGHMGRDGDEQGMPVVAPVVSIVGGIRSGRVNDGNVCVIL